MAVLGTAVQWLWVVYLTVLSATNQAYLLTTATQTAFLSLGLLVICYLPMLPATVWWETRHVCTIFNEWREIQVGVI